MKTTPKNLAKLLRNIGPMVAEKLIHAGIDTPEKLKKARAKKAFLKIYQKKKKTEFKALTEKLRSFSKS